MGVALARLTIGSRASKLAMTQSRWVADELRKHHPGLTVEIVEITTTGDRDHVSALTVIGGKGAFTKELEEAILDGRCDIAVHSLKDLPTTLPDGLAVLCTPPREDTRDVVILREELPGAKAQALAFLPAGITVGTSSLRRRAQLARLRGDLKVIEFRGNVDTRLRKLREGQAFACILAAAGLKRLGLLDESRMLVDGLPAHWLESPEWYPAVGQGALGIEGRAGDTRVQDILAALHHAATGQATAAERAFLRALGAGCNAPVGAIGQVEGSAVALTGCVLAQDGSQRVLGDRSDADAEACGADLAGALIRNGAQPFL
jgi:hydroxymethylbilane synthase